MRFFPITPFRRSALILGTGLLFGLVISPLTYNIYSFFVPTPGNIVALNSDTINRAGLVCDLLHTNSDIMGRFSHYIKPHTKMELFCLECSGGIRISNDDLLFDEPIDSPRTGLSQVYKDAREVNNSMAQIQMSLETQRNTLSNNLQRLRDQSYPRSRDQSHLK